MRVNTALCDGITQNSLTFFLTILYNTYTKKARDLIEFLNLMQKSKNYQLIVLHLAHCPIVKEFYEHSNVTPFRWL